MLLQNNCINNGVTNDLKERKNMQTALYGKIKESRERDGGGEWLIGGNTLNIHYFSIVTTQHKTKALKGPIDEA